ncbi:sensor histidine kinase [Micromonospora sp. CA-246542]|uniref:sensor histidine kinase n=1 Tax=Micromonospora sp. CA-246542 TaxID=3239959 RepID=UPI003D8EB6A2
MSHRRPSRLDLLLGATLAVCLVLGTLLVAGAQQDHPHPPLETTGVLLIVLAAIVTMTLRRIAPVIALLAAIVVVNSYLILGNPYGPIQLCIVIAMFEAARQLPIRVSMLVCGLAAALASGTVVVRLAADATEPRWLALAWTSWLIVPWSLGSLAHMAAVSREQARRDLVARAALEERMRIAGEVHDVAGHGLALVAMQAGTALLVFQEQPDQARRALEAIQSASARSLDELRRMLDVFHGSRDDEVPLESVDARLRDTQPSLPAEPTGEFGLIGLLELVEQVRAGGLPVELDLRLRDALPKEVDLVAYRLVQESLTNVLRHAGPARARVRVAVDDQLLVEVRDDGYGRKLGVLREGRGLSGMRRRVEALGGELEAHGDRDGFRVRARLPLAEVRA